MIISAAQIRAARALLGWSQDELAERANIARTTVIRLELGTDDPRVSTVEAVRAAFEKAGIHFLSDADGGEGLQLRRARRMQKGSATSRASSSR